MAINLWRGPNGKVGAPTSGDFTTAANWSTGMVPDGSINAAFGRGDYTVALNNAVATVDALNIGAGVKLDIVGGNVSFLTIKGDAVSDGAVRIAGATMALEGEFVNFGTIAGQELSRYTSLIVDGLITNEGLITTIGQIGLPYLHIRSTIHNDDGGVISAALPGQLALTGTTTNAGLIAAANGGLLTTSAFGETGSVTNVVNQILSGGTWTATGAGSTLWLAGSSIKALGAGATVSLSGAGSTFRVDNGSSSTVTTIEQTLTTVRAGARLEVLGGRDYTTNAALAVSGALELGGGTFTVRELRADKDSTVTGFGTVSGQARVDGLIRADANPADAGDTLRFTTSTNVSGRVAGQGTLELSGGEDTFATSHVTVQHLLFDGADIQIDRSFRYAGALTMTTGTVDLKDSVLTLSGSATLSGGTIEGGPGGKLTVTGDVDARGGPVDIEVRTVRIDGDVGVDHGTLTLNGTVSGGGALTVSAEGTLILGAASHLGGGPLVTLAGSSASLVFETLDTANARVAGFSGGDHIDFTRFASADTRLTWRADDDGTGGTLRLINPTQSATLHLEENHTRADFAITDDGDGGVLVTLAAPGAAKPAFAAVDAGAFGTDRGEIGAHAFAPGHDWHAVAALV